MSAVGTSETFVPIYTAADSWKQLRLVGLPLDVYGHVITGSLGSPACVSVLPLGRSWWDKDIASQMRCYGDGKRLNSLPVCYTSPAVSVIITAIMSHPVTSGLLHPTLCPSRRYNHRGKQKLYLKSQIMYIVVRVKVAEVMVFCLA
jgi:hypothetical protein